jgi:polar amino acid transport system substrate-binding protein
MVLMVKQQGANPALRVALNMNNTALVQRTSDGYTGLAIQIAERIGAEMGTPLTYVEHPNARSVLQAEPDGWDLAFLAIDPARRDRIAFSDPYHSIEATFLVRDGLQVRSCEDILRGDHTMLSAKGAAYQARLSALGPKGPIVLAASPDEARRRFVNGEGAALAGIRETLEASRLAGTHVLPDSFAHIHQAVAVPIRNRAQIALINKILLTWSAH